jgi:hypothetical protein
MHSASELSSTVSRHAFYTSPNWRHARLDGIKLLAAKSLQELLRVRQLLKAIDVKPLAIVIKRVASRAERQVSTELMYLVVAIALAEPRR